MTSQKGSRFKNFEIKTSSSVFSPKKTYTYQFLDQNNHFIGFYCVFSAFSAILGKIEGQWRQKRGQDLNCSKLWHHHRLFIEFLVNFGLFWVKLWVSDVTKGSRFKNFEIMTSWSVFSPQKTYTYQFLDQNDHFIAFYRVFGFEFFGFMW